MKVNPINFFNNIYIKRKKNEIIINYTITIN